MNAVQKLRSVVTDLKSGKPGAAENWELAFRLLSRMNVGAAQLDELMKSRNVDTLDRIVVGIEHPVAAAPSSRAFPEVELDRAYKAFNKRLKLMRLADESKLGGRYTSGGRKSSIDAIRPPEEFPKEIWDALVRAGKLRAEGPGFYAPRDEAH